VHTVSDASASVISGGGGRFLQSFPLNTGRGSGSAVGCR